jgi:hypothetical protein
MITVQEYFTTSYEADREYVDGELLERHSGEQPHTRVHGVLAALLFRKEREAGVRVLMSQRYRLVQHASASRMFVQFRSLIPAIRSSGIRHSYASRSFVS